MSDRWTQVRGAVPAPVKRTVVKLARAGQSALYSVRPPKDPAECPICGTIAARFLPFKGGGSQPASRFRSASATSGTFDPEAERRCPNCASLERHHAVWLYFQRRTNLFTAPVQMLHIAPEGHMKSRLSARANIEYLTADLDSPAAMIKMDITDIQYPDDSFDVIYASDVLEHIPDDELAMRELRRVLRPGGWAILLVPIWGDRTKEDLSIIDPAEREREFGQFDHVRLYGHDGEYERRLRRSGFEVKVEHFAADLGPQQAHRYRLRERDDIYYCT